MRVKSRKNWDNVTRRDLERIAIVALLFVAWGWIMVTFGMIFYHGYYNKNSGLWGQQRQQKPHPAADGKLAPPTPPKRLERNSLAPQESPLLIFTCNRDQYLKETLEDIYKYIPKDCSIGCPIVVSQDGNKQEVQNVIHDFTARFEKVGIPLVHLQHKSGLRGGRNAYQALAVHYGWALGQVFDGVAHAAASPQTAYPRRVIILEEDIHIAPDFFDYFKASAPLLDNDPSLFAVSAFNDNGFKANVKDATRILRSDFFPGLGWMMTKRLWNGELKVKWPQGYWDDWLRDPPQRQDRHVLRPEVSRTFHFGVSGGASSNQFGGHLSRILLNPTPVKWQEQDLSGLLEAEYNKKYYSIILAAKPADSVADALKVAKDTDARVEYSSFAEFQRYARLLNLMDDEKAGIPRTAYKGVVETRPHGDHLLFLTPSMVQLAKDFSSS